MDRPGLTDALRGFLGSRRWLVALLYPALLAVVRKFNIPLTDEDLSHIFYLALAVVTGESAADIAARWKSKPPAAAELPSAPPAPAPAAGGGPGAAAALLVCILGGGLLLSGCSLFAPPKEDTLALRLAVSKEDEGLRLLESVNRKNFLDFAEELRARSFGEVDQAVLDDLRRLEKEGKLSLEEVTKLHAEASKRKLAAVDAIEARLRQALDPQAARDLREVHAAIRAYLLSRLNADELRADLLQQVEGLARKAGLPVPDSGGGP